MISRRCRPNGADSERGNKVDMVKSAVQAALDGTREVGFTLLSISLALMAAFIPILFMDGIIGRVFREFAMVVIVAIVGFIVLDS